MDTTGWHIQRNSFGPAAELYDRIRPTYPAAALGWMLGAPPKAVVDLGAGTGILTRQLHAAGYQVVAVEPDEMMRAQLSARLPEVPAPAGSAESMPLPDASVDGVTAGQAYHWFDTDRAHPEIARVLRPGGVFAPIWNNRDESEPWVAEITAIVGGERPGGMDLPEDLFEPVERRDFRHERPMTADSLIELIRSRSYYLTATPQRQAELEAALRELCATHPALRGKDTFLLPYVTTAYRARRR